MATKPAPWPDAPHRTYVFTYIDDSTLQYLTPQHNRHIIHGIKRILFDWEWFSREIVSSAALHAELILVYWCISLYWKAQLPSAMFDDSSLYALSCHAVEHPQLAYWDSVAFKYNMPHSKKQTCMNSTLMKAKLLSSQHEAINQGLQGER